MTVPKNLSASVKARLLAVAERRGESFNLLVVRFGVERLLYRLSQSRHADRFLLNSTLLNANGLFPLVALVAAAAIVQVALTGRVTFLHLAQHFGFAAGAAR